jgi:dihydroorotase/N-acyl-D-amino-acid deacylase
MRSVLAAAVAVASAAVLLAQGPEEAFDVVITGGRVVDGTGAPWYRADVAVTGDRIVRVGRLAGAPARLRVDATDLVVAPGFIDMLGQSEFNVLVDNRAASKVYQGVTTELTGEGTSIGPLNDRVHQDDIPTYEHFGVVADWRTLGEYLARLDARTHPAINLGSFVGAGGLRAYVMGKDDRPATASELAEMKRLAAEAMEDGAFGLSSSLQYVPDRFATTDELTELARAVAPYGGIYITHQRSESGRIFESLDEVFAIAERARIPAEVFHLKTAYRANWGKMPDVLARLHAARARGLDVTANQYPYTRASNGLDACLPLWVREGGTDRMIGRLRDPAVRDRIKRDMADPKATTWENQWYGSGGADGVMVSSVINPELRKYEGKTLAEIGRAMGKDPRDAVMDLVVADRAQTSVIISIMSEEDVRAALRDPLVAIGTDSGARAEDGPLSENKSHPRGWGSFARILGTYVRDEHVLTLEEAIFKMTSRPATRVGLTDRGVLRPGMMADITVFNPATIRDVASYAEPTHYATGVEWVLVNGKVVLARGRMTGERPGRALRGPGWKGQRPLG